MENASKVMYKIANVFNWIALVAGLALAVVGLLIGVNVITPDTVSDPDAWIAVMVAGIWFFAFSLLLIILTRIAYKKNSSKGWDILFLILGFLGGDIFYVLGGIFGLVGDNN